jgi:spore coat polysaccharide biosynthesis protein SpsF
VVLATSTDVTDDVLAWRAATAGVQVCRGSLDDVLSRFLIALKDLSDNDIVVRATADNPLPDGRFVDSLLEMFLNQRLTYFGTDSPADGLPHGLSAEVCSVGALRERVNLAPTSSEREHVTPALRQPSPASQLLRANALIAGNFAHLRCSVDTLDDYLQMAAVFDYCDDPAGVAWQDLLTKLPSGHAAPQSDTDGKEASATR